MYVRNLLKFLGIHTCLSMLVLAPVGRNPNRAGCAERDPWKGIRRVSPPAVRHKTAKLIRSGFIKASDFSHAILFRYTKTL